MTTSGGYVLASDNKGACVHDQTPHNKSATGTGTLTFSSNGISHLCLNIPKFSKIWKNAFYLFSNLTLI